jgi:hypothetical protein
MPRSRKTYTWNQRDAPGAAPATAAGRIVADVESTMIVPALAAARAVAASASACANCCSATGATRIGAPTVVPSTVMLVSTVLTSTSTRGLSFQRANAAMFSRSVDSSPAPPRKYSHAFSSRRSRASSS